MISLNLPPVQLFCSNFCDYKPIDIGRFKSADKARTFYWIFLIKTSKLNVLLVHLQIDSCLSNHGQSGIFKIQIFPFHL